MQFKIKPSRDSESNMLIDFYKFIYEFNDKGQDKLDYMIQHVKLVNVYAQVLNKRMNLCLDRQKLTYISYAHDLFKERGLDETKSVITWNNHQIFQDLNRYVRTNLDVLEEYGLDEYFNTDVQLHALSSGIFLRTELGIKDPHILYPVMFHSCPILPIYETLNGYLRKYIDVIMLADKLSSNHLKINMLEKKVPFDLDLCVFGLSGNECNYTLGLYMARLLGQGSSTEEQSVTTTEYYYKRLANINPLICNNDSIKKLGGNASWPKRKSPVLTTH